MIPDTARPLTAATCKTNALYLDLTTLANRYMKVHETEFLPEAQQDAFRVKTLAYRVLSGDDVFDSLLSLEDDLREEVLDCAPQTLWNNVNVCF